MSTQRIITTLFALLAVLTLSSSSAFAKGKPAFGARVGLSSSPDQFVFGVQSSFGKAGGAAGTADFVPSVDLGFGDNFTSLLINGDLRWYLMRLPETGIKFYGAAGPTVAYYSAKGGGTATEIGLSLTAGARIPMKGYRSYNVEVRFGFGDIPDLKVILALMF